MCILISYKFCYPVIDSRSSPVISLGQCGSGGRSSLLLSPHQVLQLAKLVSQVGVGWWNGFGDGWVDVDDAGLRGGTQVSITYAGQSLLCSISSWSDKITFQCTDIISPELCLLSERNVASVEVQRHLDVSLRMNKSYKQL